MTGLPPWAVDCRSSAFDSALAHLLDEWRPDIVEIHLQAMAQYVAAPARMESRRPRGPRSRLGLGRRAPARDDRLAAPLSSAGGRRVATL